MKRSTYKLTKRYCKNFRHIETLYLSEKYDWEREDFIEGVEISHYKITTDDFIESKEYLEPKGKDRLQNHPIHTRFLG